MAQLPGCVEHQIAGFVFREAVRYVVVGLIQDTAVYTNERHARGRRVRNIYHAHRWIGLKANAVAGVVDITDRFDAIHAPTGVFRFDAETENQCPALRDGVIGARVRLRRCLRLFRDGQDVFIRAADGEGIKFGVRQIFRAAGFQHISFGVLQHIARQRRVEHAVKPAGLPRRPQIVHGRPRDRLRHAAQVRFGIVHGDTPRHGFAVRTDVSVPQLLHGDVVQP